jgi:hypothetical protein
VEAGGFRLGSCALLPGSRFALTVSHIVAKPSAHREYRVVFPAEVGADEGAVTKIHWSSAETYDCSAPSTWPASVAKYHGDNDRLVLLELSKPIAAGVAPLPYLPAGREPIRGDRLIIAGFGEDERGNHARTAWVATSRFRETDATGFGLHAPRRDDLFNGMPRAGDSGGPVFWPPMSNPFEQRYLRLAGVHSERRRDPETGAEVARFVKIDLQAVGWIRRTVQGAGATLAAQTALQSDAESTRSAALARQFCYRAAEKGTFYRFNDPPNEIKDVKMKLVTRGAEKMLKDGSEMQTHLVSDPTHGHRIKLAFVNADGKSVEVLLKRSKVCGGGHWYTDDPDPDHDPDYASKPPTQDCYYLFLMSDKPKPGELGPPRVPLVLLEAYAKGSGHRRPTTDNLFEPDCATSACKEERPSFEDPWAPDVDEAPNVRTPDQDDEGNGEEDP